MSDPPPTVARAPLFALGFLAFLLMGLLQAGYGPAFPALQRDFGVGLGVVGTIATLHFAGSAFGPLLLRLLLNRLSLRGALATVSSLMILGLLGVALLPTWGLALLGALVGGLGMGGLSAGFNIAFARLGSGPSNLVNGVFGVGSVLSPLLVVLVGQGHGTPFLIIAGLTGLLLAGLRALPNLTIPHEAPGGVRPSRALLPLFGLLFFLYVGLEAGYGSWITTYVRARGSTVRPEYVTSGYWLALTLGRFLFAGLAGVPPLRVLLLAGVGAALCALGSLLPGSGLIFLVLAGLCIAPVFSTALSLFARVLPPRRAPYMLTLGSVGGAVLPLLTGAAMAAGGVLWMPLCLLICALLFVAVVAGLRRRLAPQLAAGQVL